jgi:pyruvate/2-oxoglutarate dehydrogenase complex dihydrolipoamide acyltransferase (E2) component
VGEEEFLSNPQRWNKYGYALNNPLRYVDPDGEEPADPTTLQKVGTVIVSIVENKAPAAASTWTCPVCLFFSLFERGNTPNERNIELEMERRNREAEQQFKEQQQQPKDPQQPQAQPSNPGTVKPATPAPQNAHKNKARPSTEQKHQEGESRKGRDQGSEKGDDRRRPNRKRPKDWNERGGGPWPPKPPKPPDQKLNQ